ncbi:hypothetical protein ElyMa_003213400, partial [Elysia marginata]
NATTMSIASGGGSDSGVIIGVVVAVVVLVILAAVVVVVVLYRKGENGRIHVDEEENKVVRKNPVYTSGDVQAANGGAQYRDSDLVVKKNPVYASSKEAHDNGSFLRDSDYVVKQNPVYATSGDATGGQQSDEVIRQNPVYGSGFILPGKRSSSKVYKDYTEVEPTITSASAAPANMSKPDGDTYESVGNVEKPKAAAAPKPKPKPSKGAKPSNSNVAPGSPPPYQVDDAGPVEEPYAMISQTSKLPRQPTAPEPDDEEDFLPDPATKPEVPTKQFEEGRGGCCYIIASYCLRAS